MAEWRARLNGAMERYADGDDAAFEEVYDLLAPRLRAFLGRRDPKEAEDLMQQAFLHIIETRGTYVSKGDVLGWALAIACHLQIDHYRKARRLVLADGEPVEVPDPSAADVPDGWLSHDQTLSTVEAVLEELPDAQRLAWVLFRLLDMPVAEIATTLKTSPGAVKVRVHRTNAALKAALALDERAP